MIALRILAGVIALLWATVGFALVDLATLVLWDDEFVPVMPLEASWAALTSFFIVVPLGFVTVAPRRWPAAVLLVLIAAASLVAGALLSSALGPLWLALAALVSAGVVGIFGLLSPDRRRGIADAYRLGPDWLLVALAIAGVALWVPFVIRAVSPPRDAPTDTTLDIDHWPVHAAAGIAVALGIVIAALMNGMRRLAGVAVGLSSVTIGVSVAVSTGLPVTAGLTQWSVLAVLWGAVVLVALLRTRRRKSAQTVVV